MFGERGKTFPWSKLGKGAEEILKMLNVTWKIYLIIFSDHVFNSALWCFQIKIVEKWFFR